MRNFLTLPSTSLSGSRPLWRRPRWLIGGLAAFAILLVIAFGVIGGAVGGVPDGLDYSTTRLSEQELFRIGYTPDLAQIPINQLHTWTLHVETAAGELVEDAEIVVDGDMPQHGHGLPTQPVVTQYLGNGDYLVEGVKFQMGGWWVMEFTVNTADQTDVVQFNLNLE